MYIHMLLEAELVYAIPVADFPVGNVLKGPFLCTYITTSKWDTLGFQLYYIAGMYIFLSGFVLGIMF